MDRSPNPLSFRPGQRVITVGRVFGTPLAVQGATWLPLNQLLFWLLFAWLSLKKHPTRTGFQHFTVAGLRMAVLLGSEWLHNLAHVAAARAIGKPVDTMRILLGMPVLIYDQPEHPSITPPQHILRSAGGPACNLVLLLLCKLLQPLSPPGTAARDITDTAAGMNAFIVTGSLLPVPVLDGGPLLKWSLIANGKTPEQAARTAARVQKVVGIGLLGSAAVVGGKNRWLLALILSWLGALSLATGLGKLKM